MDVHICVYNSPYLELSSLYDVSMKYYRLNTVPRRTSALSILLSLLNSQVFPLLYPQKVLGHFAFYSLNIISGPSYLENNFLPICS